MAKRSECGFLTLRDKKDGLLPEITDDYRVSGKVPNFLFGEVHNHPICKERFESALKQACEQKPKPSTKSSKT
jgi:hypothetical protein